MTGRRTGDTTRGLVAATALTVVVVGVPVLLIASVGWPLPRSVPSLGDVTATFTGDRPLETSTVWKVLAVGAWIAWAQVAAATVIEVAAVLRGSVAGAVRGLGLGQSIAAPLVAAIVFAWPTSTTARAAAPPPLDPASVSPATTPAPPAEAVASADADEATFAIDTPAATTEHVVQPRETLWGLAQRYLGDGNRVGELFELNRGRPQPGGGVLTTPGELRVGWVLAIPTTEAAAPDHDDAPATTVTVVPGDTLWDLADEHLDDPYRYPEILDLNEGRVQPDGRALTDPDLILPGWQLDLPTVEGQPLTPSPEAAPAAPETVPESPPASEPQPTVDTTPAESDVEVSASPPPTASEAVPLADAGDPSEESGPTAVPVGLIGGGITTAGVLALLERRRRAQQRRRHRGDRIEPTEPAAAEAERALRAGAAPDTAAIVEAALRAATAGPAERGPVRVEYVVADAERVTIATHAEIGPPPGFVEAGAGCWATAVTARELADLGRPASFPTPALIAVGTNEAGAEILVDLEALGVVALDGEAREVQAHLRAAALHATSTPWREGTRVLVVGDGLDPDAMVDADGCSSLDDALDRTEAHAAGISAALTAAGWTTTVEARRAAGPEGWEPLVLIASDPPDPEQQRRVDALCRSGAGVAILTPLGGATAGRTWTIERDGALTGPGLPPRVQARQLTAADVQAVEDLLEQADHPPVPAVEVDDPPVRPIPLPLDPAVGDETIDVDAAPVQVTVDALLEEVDVVVRVLGTVAVVRPASGEAVTVSKQKALEAIAYLALREVRVDRDELQAALWPDGRNSAKTLHNTLWVARRALGEGRDGTALLPDPTEGHYQLDDRVVSDYGIFHELVARAEELEDAEAAAALLADALTLVEGEPFTGAGRSYSWVAPHAGIIVAEVVDAAEELAEVRLAAADWRGAEWAARQGLRTFPCEERLYRILMRCAEASGSVPAVHRIYDELTAALADPDDGVEPEDTVHPETIALLDALTGATGPDKATA